MVHAKRKAVLDMRHPVKQSGLLWILAFLAASPWAQAVQLGVVKNIPEQEIVISFKMQSSEILLPDAKDDHPVFRVAESEDLQHETCAPTPVISRFIQISNFRIPEIHFSLLETAPLTLSPDVLKKLGNRSGLESFAGLTELQAYHPAENSPFASLGRPSILRDIRTSLLSIRPIQWNPQSQRYELITSAVVTIRMSGEDTVNVIRMRNPVSSIAFNHLYEAVLLNYTPLKDQRTGEPEEYVIVVPDSYESRLQGFIAWKEEQGFSIHVVRTSEIFPPSSAESLRNLILNLFNSESPPVYVMIVGDENSTPVYTSYDPTHPGDYADDLYFSLLAGDDILPDVFLSRMPADSAYEMTVMLNKVMNYELNPQLDNPAFYTSAIMAASGLEESQIITKEQTAERLETYCNYTQIHRIYEWDNYTTGQIMDTIDTGVSIINYRGEGWRRGWNPLHSFWFDQNDVYELENPYLTPFITSIGCGVNLFNTPDDCFGHAFMAHGTPFVPMGAVCIIGPTWNTHTSWNNWLDRGMYRGYVYWEVYQSVPMLNYGILYMIQQFPEPEDEVTNEVQARTFVCFGTPDLFIRTGVPVEPIVGLAYGNNSMDRYISVRDANAAIVDHGLVSFTANGQRWVMKPDEDGGVDTGLTSISSNTIDIMVSGKNLIPQHLVLPWQTGGMGQLLITEIKPDIPTDGTRGDMVEIYNSDMHSIDLSGWILSDLDGYDIPILQSQVILQPQQIAVIECVGPQGQETVTTKPYGVFIQSRSIPDFSSLEDVAVLRDPSGRIVDSLAWHDNSGSASSNAAEDMSKITAGSSPIDVLTSGWWNAPDNVTQENYELYAIDWSPFAGNDGPGSIQRSSIGSPDGKGHFTIQIETGFGSYYH